MSQDVTRLKELLFENESRALSDRGEMLDDADRCLFGAAVPREAMLREALGAVLGADDLDGNGEQLGFAAGLDGDG